MKRNILLANIQDDYSFAPEVQAFLQKQISDMFLTSPGKGNVVFIPFACEGFDLNTYHQNVDSLFPNDHVNMANMKDIMDQLDHDPKAVVIGGGSLQKLRDSITGEVLIRILELAQQEVPLPLLAWNSGAVFFSPFYVFEITGNVSLAEVVPFHMQTKYIPSDDTNILNFLKFMNSENNRFKKAGCIPPPGTDASGGIRIKDSRTGMAGPGGTDSMGGSMSAGPRVQIYELQNNTLNQVNWKDPANLPLL